ncbi:hypothetical protein ABE945_15905, partial [Enterococcus gilvus]|uniref:hypothetical protein n=1 Tax=Enterococcus gilvus TaxID=160453 RepID=UPI003D6B0926
QRFSECISFYNAYFFLFFETKTPDAPKATPSPSPKAKLSNKSPYSNPKDKPTANELPSSFFKVTTHFLQLFFGTLFQLLLL